MRINCINIRYLKLLFLTRKGYLLKPKLTYTRIKLKGSCFKITVFETQHCGFPGALSNEVLLKLGTTKVRKNTHQLILYYDLVKQKF